MLARGCLAARTKEKQIMGEAFRLGGWGMYPTTFIGLILLAAAFRFAASPLRGRLAPIAALGVLVTLSSCLGFVTGVIKTFSAAGPLEPNERGGVVIMGIGESLHNIGLGLVLLVLATIGVVIGLTRSPRRADRGADLVDPLAK
jgi:hypothetical protein